jgi:hypothetical protein
MMSGVPKLTLLVILSASLLVLPGAAQAARKRAPSKQQLIQQLRQAHGQQLRARGVRQRRRAERKAHKAYAELSKLIRSSRSGHRQRAVALLESLVKQSSSPSVADAPRLYPKLNIRNHNRLIAVAERNLRRLMGMAAGFARSRGAPRDVAREMVTGARPQRYSALVGYMRAARRLGDKELARRAALQAILAFRPADRLALDRTTNAPRIRRQRAAELTEVLRTARGTKPINIVYHELRREDARYYGWSAAPRLQAIAYLTRYTRGWAAKKLKRELKRWQPEAGLSLVSRPGDRWIAASYTTRSNGQGFGYLVPRKLLARCKLLARRR